MKFSTDEVYIEKSAETIYFYIIWQRNTSVDQGYTKKIKYSIYPCGGALSKQAHTGVVRVDLKYINKINCFYQYLFV